MPRKKTPLVQTLSEKTVVSREPVVRGDVLSSFVREVQALSHEVVERRAFDDDVATFLREKALVEAFNEWRAARSTAR